MSTTGYNRPNEDQEGSSGVENDTKDSEVEALSSVEDASSEVPKDYWFGKKYFEFVLAQDLLSRTPLHEPVPDIDSNLEAAIRDFPFQQSLTELQEKGIQASDFCTLDEDAYKALIVLTGAVIRKGTTKQKNALIATLQKSRRTETGDASSGFGSREINVSQRESHSEPNRPAATELARYTMALEEHGVKEGFKPDYRYQIVNNDPLTFKATLYFKGFTFEGSAKTKKIAKHLASKDACVFLKIELI